jgi:hypothetical protein
LFDFGEEVLVLRDYGGVCGGEVVLGFYGFAVLVVAVLVFV